MALNFPQLEGKRNHAREIELGDEYEGILSRLFRLVARKLFPGEHEGFQPLLMFVVFLSVLTMWVADARRERVDEDERAETTSRNGRAVRLETKRHVPVWDLR